MTYHSHRTGLRSLALFEAAKGILAIIGSIIIFAFSHKDLTEVAEHVLSALHVHPGSRFAGAVFRAADKATTQQVVFVGIGVLVYAAVRLIEAVGLWHERDWAEWFALLSGCLYLPWEIYEIARHQTPIRVGILVVNIIVVLYLAFILWQSHQDRKKMTEAA